MDKEFIDFMTRLTYVSFVLIRGHIVVEHMMQLIKNLSMWDCMIYSHIMIYMYHALSHCENTNGTLQCLPR